MRNKPEIVAPGGSASANGPTFDGYDPLNDNELADPYPSWSRARRDAPVFFMPMYGMWSVTSYADVRAVLHDPKTFSSASAVKGPPPPQILQDRLPNGYPWEYPTLVNLDPPQHGRIRKLCQTAFGPKHVAAREEQITAVAERLISEFVTLQEVELVSQFSNPLPLAVITAILGVPAADSGQISVWTDDAVRLLSPAMDAEEQMVRSGRAADFYEYCVGLVEDRRVNIGPDLVSDLINVGGGSDEQPLNTDEIVGIISQLLIAGSETTSSLISHTVLYLLSEPPQCAAVLEDPSLMTLAIEESLRRRGPSKGLFRRTTRETELGNVSLPAGTLLHVLFSSANHDETVFAEPERFDFNRTNLSAHIAFGHGIHFCLGAPLARLEGRVAVNTLLARLPGLRVVEPQQFEYASTLGTQSLLALHLQWDRQS